MLRRTLIAIFLSLFYAPPRLFVHGHIFSWLVDWQTVCEPDYVQCPNGGLTFRDRAHDCQFTPCEFIPNPPLPPPPPNPKTLSVHKWFGRYEFMVPTLNVEALQRGKAVECEWIQAIIAKRDHPLRANFSAMIDLYIVPTPSHSTAISSEHAVHARDLHLDALVASQTELFVEEAGETEVSASIDAGMSSTARELAVSLSPWTRWEFFGQFGGSRTPPTFSALQTALRLLKNKTTVGSTPTTTTRFASLVLEAASDVDIMTDLVAQCDKALATIRVPSPDTSQKPSILVFPTDFRTVIDTSSGVNDDLSKLWNMTRIPCNQSVIAMVTAQRNISSASISLPDSSIHVLLSPRIASNSTDAGDVESETQGNCSCWSRGLVDDRSINHTTQWMLCS